MQFHNFDLIYYVYVESLLFRLVVNLSLGKDRNIRFLYITNTVTYKRHNPILIYSLQDNNNNDDVYNDLWR